MSSEDDDDIEKLRQKNAIEKSNFLDSLMGDPLFSDTVKEINVAAEQERYKSISKPTNKRKRSEDTTFRTTAYIPLERRKSSRLQNRKPQYTYLDLSEELEGSPSTDPNSIKDLEEIVYKVKKRRRTTTVGPPAKIILVEEVTDQMIKDICTTGVKVYGSNGTSCHQCRQKTVDTKTICRSGYCVGVRGQFCGSCVINRYGEDPAEALKDPKWKCYVCRASCNCSFCRLKQGKRPTGILAPLAKTNGYKSVQDFLVSLKGFGDRPDVNYDKKSPEMDKGLDNSGCDGKVAVKDGTKLEKVPGSLLGFDDKVAIVVGDKGCPVPAKHPHNLLGFDGNTAVMVGKKVELVPFKPNYST